jgi:formate-dependent nitrite reductase membrane component NrfD
MNEIQWGMPIAIYLFLAGLSAGAFSCTALTGHGDAEGRGHASQHTIVLLIPFMLAVGIVMLIFDLGQRISFWKLLINFRLVSPMSLGAWILVFFFILSVIWAIILIPERFRSLLSRGPKWLCTLQKIDRKKIGFGGSALAVLVAVYTGVLLSSTAVPLWNWMLPLLFLFSSFSSGHALEFLTILRYDARGESSKAQPGKSRLQPYRTLLIGQLLAALAFLLLTYLTQSREVVLHLISGGIGFLWWVGAVGAGILFPLVMTRYRGTHAWVIFATLLGELAGAFIMRWSILIAGQI